MKRLTPRITMYVTSLLISAQSVLAADIPTEAFPDNVTAVIRLGNPQQSVQKAVNFVSKIDPQFAPVVQLGVAGLGVAISNPAQTGVDAKGDWWFAVFAHADREPSLVFAIPAADADAMKQAIQGNFQFISYENWLLYTEDEQTAARIKKRLGGEGRAIHDAVDERVKQLFGNSDCAVYINLQQLSSEYRDEIDRAHEQLKNGIEEMQNFAPPVEGVDLSGTFQMYAQMASGLFQALDDSQSCSLALSFGDDSVSIEELFLVKAGTATDKLLAQHKPSQLSNITKLEPDQLMYAGFRGNYGQLMSLTSKFYTSMIPDKAKADKLVAAMQDMSQLQVGDYSMSFGLGDLKGGAVRSAVVADIQPTDKARTLGRKLIKVMGEMSIGGVQQQYDLKTEAETVSGHAVDILRVKQQVNEQLDPLGIQNQIMTVLYGNEMTTRTVYLDGKSVQTIGGGTTALENTLKSLSAPQSSSNSPAQATRDQLLKQANIMMLIDLPGFAVDVMRLVVESGQVPIPLNQQSLDKLNLKRSYSGFSMSTVKQGVRVKTTVPILQIQGVVKIGQLVRQLMGGQPDF